MNNSVILNTMDIPIINSFDHFCEILSISRRLLFLLTNKNEYFYQEIDIPKKDHSIRKIYAPNITLKSVQKWILNEILEKIHVAEAAVAFVPQKNGLFENANRHAKNIYILEMDLSNFFETITDDQVYALFSKIGYGSKVSRLLTNICTYHGKLPQGAVTSPYIANLVCFHMDSRLQGFCNKNDIVYTRYADDIAFSSNNRSRLNKVEGFIRYIIQDEGFIINERKTRYLSNDVKKTITGITINDGEIHVNKLLKKKLRAEIYNSIKNMNYTQNSHIIGEVAYINSIEPGYCDKIKVYISKIIEKPEFMSQHDIVNAYNEHKIYTDLPEMKYKKHRRSVRYQSKERQI